MTTREDGAGEERAGEERLRGMAHKDKSARRFDAWSDSYEKSLTWKLFYKPVHDAMASSIGEVRGLRVLDVGCGTGAMLRRFARSGAARLVGVDTSVGMLRTARRLSEGLNSLEFTGGSAAALPVRDSEFDLVMSSIAFHHFPDGKLAMSEMARALKPGGKIFVCDMSGEGVRGRFMLAYGRLAATDRYYYDRATLERLALLCGLEPLEARHIRFLPRAFLLSAVKRA